jgi:hypothetical protein
VSPVSVVLRLLPGPAADGHLVGYAEVVATGEVVPIREVAALVELTRRLGTEQAAEGAGEAR